MKHSELIATGFKLPPPRWYRLVPIGLILLALIVIYLLVRAWKP